MYRFESRIGVGFEGFFLKFEFKGGKGFRDLLTNVSEKLINDTAANC